MRNVKGGTECLFKMFLHICGEERSGDIAKSIKAAIDDSLLTSWHNKLFSNISYQANKLLKHL